MLNPFTTFGQLTSAEISFVQNLVGLSYAQGDILYYNGTSLTRLPAGTNGWFLKTQGVGANPTWVAVPGGGDMLAATYDALGISGQIAGRDYANSFTKSQAILPDSDVISLAVRRNSSGQTAKIFEIQTEANATLASFDKSGNLAAANFSGSSSGTNTGDNATNTQYSSLVSNATHTGDATGATTLTVVALNGTNLAALGTGVLKNTTTTGVPFISKVTITEPATSATITILNGKTLTVNKSITLEGTDSTTMTFPTTSKTLAANDGSNWTLASQAIGDLAYASSTTAYTRLAAVAVGQVLVSAGTGTAPAWSATPLVTSIDIGNADTTISRSAAGIIAVEGVAVPLNSITNTHTAQQIELGHASDTTIARVSAGVASIEGNNIVVNTSSPTLATITTTGNIELGNASDTTISRLGAADVGIEGVAILTTSNTKTLTNKRVNPRTASSTTSATLTPDLSSANVYFRTTQTEALTIGAPTGTPVIGETIMIYVDSAGAQTLTMNATYKVFGAAFPATTTAGKTLMISAQYNGTDWKTLWAVAQ